MCHESQVSQPLLLSAVYCLITQESLARFVGIRGKNTGESSRTRQSRMNVEVQFELVSCNLQRGGGRRGGLNRKIVVSRYGRQATDRVESSMGVLVWIGGLRFQDRGSCLRPRRGLLTAYLETHCCYDSV